MTASQHTIESDTTIEPAVGPPWSLDPRVHTWRTTDGVEVRFQFRELGAVIQVGPYNLCVTDPRSAAPFDPAPLPEPTIEWVPGNIAGHIANPKGLVLHGTRSGAAGNSTQQEYQGTVNYVRNGTDGETGWHVTVGDGIIAIHMEPDEYGWHARAASDNYLACEFAQATIDKPISDAQVETFCWWVQHEVLPVYPTIPHVLRTHAELEDSGETGQQDGKSDVFMTGSAEAEELKQRIRAKLGWDDT